jgi:hypothetical protein
MNQPEKITLKLSRSLLKRIQRERKIEPAAYMLNLLTADLERAGRCRPVRPDRGQGTRVP